jgi:multidrug efflux system membrane fusion protein
MPLIRHRLTILACVALASGSAWAQTAPSPATPSQTTPNQPAATPQAAAAATGPGVPATVTRPSRRDVPVYLRGLGSVAAFKSVLIRSRVDGTLERVAFTEGDDVKQGDVLAQIDPRPYQAALDQALAKKASDEANLSNAKLDLTRSTQLARNQFAAQQTVDTRQATVAQLEAGIKGDEALIAIAKLNLDYSRITAPFDGRVGLRQVDPGNFIRAADPAGVGIVTLSQVQPISVTFTLPQDNLPGITAAMARGKPRVLAYSADETTLLDSGELLTIDNAIDPTTGTIKVKATFGNARNRLWPGQFVNARLLVDERKNVVTVPNAAVQRGPQGLFVYVVKPDQTVALRPVEVLQDTGAISVIGKGLDENDTIVLSGQSRLSNGTRIAATQAPASS